MRQSRPYPPPAGTQDGPAPSPAAMPGMRFSGIHRYRIWHRQQRLLAVRRGWYWPAVLAPRIWLLGVRQWRTAAALVLGSILCAGLLLLLGTWLPIWALWLAASACELGVRCVCGWRGWRWRERQLRRDGWTQLDELHAISANDALSSAWIRRGRGCAVGAGTPYSRPGEDSGRRA